MAVVHYKFKSSLDYDSLTFDGVHISLADLKKSILQQKKLGRAGDFDLQVTNAQTKHGKLAHLVLEFGLLKSCLYFICIYNMDKFYSLTLQLLCCSLQE